MGDLINVVTPVGELYYVQISGQGKRNYNDDGYDYVATVNLTGEAAETLKAKIDEVLGDVPAGKIIKSKGYRELLEDDEGIYTPTSMTGERNKTAKPTGITAFTFSTQTTFKDGKTKQISVYNSANPPSKINIGERLIGNESKGAISGKMQRFERGKEVGVSLYLNAVQLVDFKEYVGDAGFESQEGGFTGSGDEFNAQAATAEIEKEQAPAKEKVKPKL